MEAKSPKKRAEQPEHTLPWPVAELIRVSEEQFSMQWFQDLSPFLAKLLEYTFIYALCYFGFGFGWILFLVSAHYLRYQQDRNGVNKTIMARLSALAPEKEVLGQAMEAFPVWVTFPDFDRAEWINDILKQLWKSLDGYATYFVVNFIEPEIKKILDQMDLNTVSRFHVKKVVLGTIPARVGGIKVYSRNVSRNEIVLDAEVTFNGDARVLITLQGVQAEVNKIRFKGMARITLKPVLPTFPFIGGFEFYFLNAPTLEYGLGGIGTFGELPGAYGLIKMVVEDQIRSRFVWPNRFHIYLPIDPVKNVKDKSYLLAKPAGIVAVRLNAARNLLKMDKRLTGGSSSDPYAIVKVGRKEVSFREDYVSKSVDPEWNYETDFVIEDYNGQELCVDVFDYDSSSKDDFLGNFALKLDAVAKEGQVDTWVTLNGVKRGEVHITCTWHEAYAMGAASADSQTPTPSSTPPPPSSTPPPPSADKYILSLFIDSCTGLAPGSKSMPYSKCVLRPPHGEKESTLIQTKTKEPVFEEGFMFMCKPEDTFSVDVVDTKGCDQLLGTVKIPVEFLDKLPRKEFFDMEWAIEVDGAAQSEAMIIFSAKLYGAN